MLARIASRKASDLDPAVYPDSSNSLLDLVHTRVAPSLLVVFAL